MQKIYFGIIILAVFISACAYDGSSTSGATDGGIFGGELTDEPVELLVWMDNEDWAMAAMQAFANIYPNVTFQFQQMGNVDSRGYMQLDGPAGLGADVFMLVHDQVTFAISDGLIEPVPEDLQEKWEEELVASAVQTATHDGRMHAVPVAVENIALFYNKQLWGPEPPQTWEEIIEFSRTYNNPATNDWTMAWDVGNSYLNFIWLTAGGMQLFGPNMDDYRQPNFDSPEAARGIELFLSMRQLFDLPLTDINFNTGEERFRLGEVPFTLTGPWAFRDLRENGVDFGVARIPTIGEVQPIAFSGNILAAVSSFSPPSKQPWAYAFIDFLVSEEGATIMFDEMYTMTSRRDIAAIPGLSDDPHFAGIAQQTPYTVPMPTIPQVAQMWNPIEEMLRFTWDGDLTIPEAQERAMDTYRLLLSVAGINPDF